MKLTEKQNAVLTAVQNADPGDFIVLRGFAGTGKSVTASEIMKSFDKSTLVITPTAAALAVLKRKIDGQEIRNVTFKTIASLMSRHQTVLKLNNFKEFSPMIATSEMIEDLKRFSDRDLKTVFQVQREIADIHPNLSIDDVSKAFFLKYIGRDKETIFKSEYDFITFDRVMQEDPTFSADNYVMMIDTDMLSDLMKKTFGINPFDPIVEESQFDFKSAESVAAEIEGFALVVIDEMSMMSEEQSNLYKRAVEICADPPITLVSGDPGQLKPVEGNFNEWCHSVEDNEKVFELTEVLRSTDAIATLGQSIRLNVPLKAIASADARIQEFPRGTSISDIYSSNEQDFKDSDMVLAFTNKDVNELNQKIRYSKGLIGHLQKDDKIVVSKNTGRDFKQGILHANGQIYIITRDLSNEMIECLDTIRSSSMNLKTVRSALANQIIKFVEVKDDEENRKYILVSSNCYSLNSRELKEIEAIVNKSLRNNLNFHEISQLNEFFTTLDIEDLRAFKFPYLVDARFAHAMTVHKSQGSQFKNVIYVVSSRDLWIQSQDLKDSRFKQAPVYVAITRAIENIKVFYIN